MVELGTAEFFFKEKPSSALIALKSGKDEWYASSLAKEVDCTFPHILKILNHFEAKNLVSFKPKNRKKLIFLTPRGHRAAQALLAVVSVLK